MQNKMNISSGSKFWYGSRSYLRNLGHRLNSERVKAVQSSKVRHYSLVFDLVKTGVIYVVGTIIANVQFFT